uniref:Uncharacterized protein n=1 Tax=Clytia hemisphaerica TaxID=252671 RepID=A0A7M6DRM0_9CNID
MTYPFRMEHHFRLLNIKTTIQVSDSFVKLRSEMRFLFKMKHHYQPVNIKITIYVADSPTFVISSFKNKYASSASCVKLVCKLHGKCSLKVLNNDSSLQGMYLTSRRCILSLNVKG